MSNAHPSVLIEIEKPVIVMRFIGKTPTQEMLAAMARLRDTTVGWPYSITLCDLTKQTEVISAETRKAIADAPQGETLGRGTAMFGATFAVRTVATLVMNVMNLTNGANDNPTKFFDDEASARAWVSERVKTLGS